MADAISTTSEASPSKAREEIVREASRIEEGALFSSKRHFETARIWGWFHWITGLPLVVLAALGSANADTIAVVDSITPVSKYIPLALLLLSVLSTFFDAQKKMVAHHASGNAYDALINEVRIFRTIGCASDEEDKVLTAQLENLSAQKNRLNETSPATPWPAYLLAKFGIWMGQGEYAVDKAQNTPS